MFNWRINCWTIDTSSLSKFQYLHSKIWRQSLTFYSSLCLVRMENESLVMRNVHQFKPDDLVSLLFFKRVCEQNTNTSSIFCLHFNQNCFLISRHKRSVWLMSSSHLYKDTMNVWSIQIQNWKWQNWSFCTFPMKCLIHTNWKMTDNSNDSFFEFISRLHNLNRSCGSFICKIKNESFGLKFITEIILK